MAKAKTLIALDVGAARIGVAVADTGVRIAIPFGAVEVNGDELKEIAYIVTRENADTIVVGYPRNQSGEPTQQTEYVENFAESLKDIAETIIFQDESLTSVIAEQRLQSRGVKYTKGDIDAEAAAIILQDYLEQYYG